MQGPFKVRLFFECHMVITNADVNYSNTIQTTFFASSGVQSNWCYNFNRDISLVFKLFFTEFNLIKIIRSFHLAFRLFLSHVKGSNRVRLRHVLMTSCRNLFNL